jgi:RNA exonuclease 1
MSKLFSNALPTKAPGDQYRFHPALNTLLSTVVPQKEKERRNKEKQKLFKKRMEDAANSRKEGTTDEAQSTETEAGAGSSYDPVLFLLTPNQMIENEYPIPTYFPLSVEGFMKGSPEDVEKGNEVFLPWNAKDKEGEAQGEKKDLPAGWKETEAATEGPKDGKYPVLAVDCEMVSGFKPRGKRRSADCL